MSKTAEEYLRESVPKDCIWEDMNNLTNTPISYVVKAMNDYAESAVREYRERQWIKVSERLPEVYNSVLFHCPGYCESEFQVGSIDRKLRVWNDAGDELTEYISSWQPLPSPPIKD